MTQQSISALVRAAIFVRDLDHAMAFYKALGLSDVYYEGELSSEDTAHVLNLAAGSHTKCVILKPPGGFNQGMVGLFEVKNPSLSPLPGTSGGPRQGETALVFYVNNIAETLEVAERLGGTRLTAPTLFRMPHRSQQEVCLRDPNGTLLNLIERPVEEALDTRNVKEISNTVEPY